MDRAADLDAALGFVTGRVNEQARLSGEPLSADQSLLLANLPSSTPNFWIPGPEMPDPPLVPRNIDYERLCALAKAAYLKDYKTNPESLDWEFALAVFTLNRHPMSSLLYAAGVKSCRRTLRDQVLVIIAAVLPLIAVILFASNGPRTPFLWAGILCGTATIMFFIYSRSQQMEQQQLENHIERCRLASQSMNR